MKIGEDEEVEKTSKGSRFGFLSAITDRPKWQQYTIYGVVGLVLLIGVSSITNGGSSKKDSSSKQTSSKSVSKKSSSKSSSSSSSAVKVDDTKNIEMVTNFMNKYGTYDSTKMNLDQYKKDLASFTVNENVVDSLLMDGLYNDSYKNLKSSIANLNVVKEDNMSSVKNTVTYKASFDLTKNDTKANFTFNIVVLDGKIASVIVGDASKNDTDNIKQSTKTDTNTPASTNKNEAAVTSGTNSSNASSAKSSTNSSQATSQKSSSNSSSAKSDDGGDIG